MNQKYMHQYCHCYANIMYLSISISLNVMHNWCYTGCQDEDMSGHCIDVKAIISFKQYIPVNCSLVGPKRQVSLSIGIV